jgi:hypothetical protein
VITMVPKIAPKVLALISDGLEGKGGNVSVIEAVMACLVYAGTPVRNTKMQVNYI